ncbi:MAG: YitT family protein, partial [Muribaculaceae bacterium]|nr:YitT family protein [Muribaculaceae bacterium]
MQMQNLRIYSRTDFRDYLIIVAGMALYAIGFTVFILPHEIVVGGMAGFSTLVFFASGGLIPVAATMY